MRRIRSTVLALAMVLFSAAAAADSIDDVKRQEAVDAVFAEYRHANTPGLAVGVYRHGRQVYAQGYGMADLENPASITPDTVFHVASVSKHFTAFAILLLAHDGKVDLNADIRKYLPYVPDFGHIITVRHLLYHTSGLRDSWRLFALGGVDSESRRRQSQVVNMMTRQRALNYTPGSEYAYSNMNYTLLAEIVRAASGQTLRQFTTQRMFRPLQMGRTFFYDDVTELVPLRANSYEKGDDGAWHRNPLNLDTVGATSLHATVGDFAKWANNFARPSVGDKALIEQFTTMDKLDDGTPINYGFALTRETIRGHQAVMHTGSDAGFRAVFAYFPEEDFSVAVLSNASLDASKSMESVVGIYLGEKPGAPQRVIPERIAAAEVAGALPGLYQGGTGSVMAFEKVNGTVVYKDRRRNASVPVVFRADGTFDLGDESRSQGRFYKPLHGRNGEIVALDEGEAGDDGRVERSQRVKPVDSAKVDLRELAGDYRSAELDATYTLSLKDGVLSVQSIWFDAPMDLRPVVKDGFAAPWPLEYVAVKRDSRGRPSALLLSSGSTRNVRFDRMQ